MTKLWKQIVLGFVAVLLVTVFGVGCGTENRRGPDSKTDLQSDIKSEVTSTVSGEKATYRQVSSDIAAEMMVTENNYVILDVRTQQEYEEGHIPGAICIPNETIGTEEIPSLPDKAQLILVYCRSGNRSKQASEKLARLGYTNVVEFGGIRDWTGETVTGED